MNVTPLARPLPGGPAAAAHPLLCSFFACPDPPRAQVPEGVMRMTFRAISLRPVLETDLPFLFQLLGDPTRVHLWLRGRPVYDEAGFRQTWSAWTSGMMGAKFIIESAGH